MKGSEFGRAREEIVRESGVAVRHVESLCRQPRKSSFRNYVGM